MPLARPRLLLRRPRPPSRRLLQGPGPEAPLAPAAARPAARPRPPRALNTGARNQLTFGAIFALVPMTHPLFLFDFSAAPRLLAAPARPRRRPAAFTHTRNKRRPTYFAAQEGSAQNRRNWVRSLAEAYFALLLALADGETRRDSARSIGRRADWRDGSVRGRRPPPAPAHAPAGARALHRGPNMAQGLDSGPAGPPGAKGTRKGTRATRRYHVLVFAIACRTCLPLVAEDIFSVCRGA